MSTHGTRKAEVPPQAGDLSAGNSLFARLDGSNSSPLLFKNALINGSFDHWQRATSAALLTSGFTSYLAADRWAVLSNAQSGNFSRQAFTYPGTEIGRSESRYYARVAVSNVTGAAGDTVQFRHHIENVHTFAGKRVILRGFVRRWAGTGNIMATLTQTLGTGGSGSVSYPWKTVPLTNLWTPFAIPFDLSSLSGKTIGTGNDDFLALVFVMSAGANFQTPTAANGQVGLQAITVDFADIELVEASAGDQAGSTRVPRDIELLRCMRYFQKVPGAALRGVASQVNVINRLGAAFPVQMRATPTLTLNNIYVWDGRAVTTVSTPTSYSTRDGVDIDCAPAANVAQYSSVIGLTGGFIDASAEL